MTIYDDDDDRIFYFLLIQTHVHGHERSSETAEQDCDQYHAGSLQG